MEVRVRGWRSFLHAQRSPTTKNVNLSTEQKNIVNCKHHRLEVSAVPGSGKTTTLTACVQYFLNQGVGADEILVLSFSNETVSWVQAKLLGAHALGSSVKVQTLHAFGLGLLAAHGGALKILNPAQEHQLVVRSVKAVRKECRAKSLWPDLSIDARRQRLATLTRLTEPSLIRVLVPVFSLVTATGNRPISEVLAGRPSPVNLRVHRCIGVVA